MGLTETGDKRIFSMWGRFKREGIAFGWFMLMYGRNQQYDKATVLQLKIGKFFKKERSVNLNTNQSEE